MQMRRLGQYLSITLRVKLTFTVLLIIAVSCWGQPGETEASAGPGWQVMETPIHVGPGDQLSPALTGGVAVYRDLGGSPAGLVVGRELAVEGGATGGGWPLSEIPVTAGPGADGGQVAWQGDDSRICLGPATGGPGRCMALPVATDIVMAGNLAVTSHDHSVIRVVNFDTMRTRILDSSTGAGGRYDPAMDGGTAVWIKERGYAGKYYEPLVVAWDAASDTQVYLTKTGGGATSDGQSILEREHPDIGAGRVVYQQRPRGAEGQWDIYEAAPDTYGVPLVTAPGDQVRPSISGNLIVFQDNRNGHPDGEGHWVGDWDIWVKDLQSGLEQPVCTAPGDQVNPRIEGDTVIWEDSRDGSWDVYSARLTQEVDKPALRLRVGGAYWKSYEEYLSGDLTVRYVLTNTGEGPALQMELRSLMTTPASVVVAGSLPAPVAELARGQAAELEVTLKVPPDITRFRTALYVRCLDAAGTESWFPGQPPDS